MKNPISVNCQKFLIAIIKWGAMSYVIGILWAIGNPEMQWWIPFGILSFFFISGMDIVVDRIILKKQLIPMKKWTSENGIPLIVGVTLASFVCGVEKEEDILIAVAVTVIIFVVMSLGITRRYLRINKHLGINVLVNDDDR